MLYQEYKNKMLKLVRILETIRKFRVLIISLTCTIIVLTAGFLITKGKAFSPELEKSEVEYGESVNVIGNALFSKQWCEYKYGNGEWSTTQTYEIGEHYVRMVGKSAFGKNRYSKELKYVVTPRKIEVSVSEGKITYGETPTLVADRLSQGDVISCDEFIYADLSQVATEIAPKLESIVIKNEQTGADVTGSYTIKIKEDDTIMFLNRPITITISTDEKEYDGTELKAEGYELTDSTLAFEDEIKVSEYPSQTEVGSADNDPSPIFVIANGDGLDVTARYDITVVKGTITVNKRPITIHTGSGKYTYADTDYENKGFTVDESTPLVEGHKITVDESTTIRNVSTTENEFTKITITDSDGNDVTENYEISYVNGTLEVVKRDITILTGTSSWVYDGKEHFSIDNYTQEGIVEGHTLEASDKTIVTNVTEKIDNLVVYQIYKDEENVTENYNVIYTYGTLEVTKRPLELKSKDQSHVYDDTPFTGSEYEIISGTVAEGQEIEPIYTGTITDVGTTESLFDAKIKAGEEDVTPNYDLKISNGILTVTKRPVTIAGKGASKEYDGKELRNEAYVLKSELDILAHHTVKYTQSASITNAGEADNIIEIEIYDGENPKTQNYDISYDTPQMLVISKREITITANSLTVIYNGKDRTQKGYEISGSGVAPEQYEAVTIEGSRKNVGESANVITDVLIRDKNLQDVTDNYAITAIDGIITIKQRPVTFVSNGTSKVYDGTELTIHSAYEKTAQDQENEGLVDGQNAELDFTGTITDVLYDDNGNVIGVDNLFTATIWEGEEETTGNYLISYEYSQLIIHPRPITFVSDGASQIYDSTLLENESAYVKSTAENEGLADGEQPEYSFTGYIIDVHFDKKGNVTGVDNLFTATIWSGERETTSNYKISYEYGKLTINKRPIKLTTGTYSKVYDGYELCQPNVTVNVTGEYLSKVSGHFISNTYETAIINVSKVDNRTIVSINGYDESGYYTDITYNYDITYSYGTLEITKRELVITTESDEKMYDGTPLTNANFYGESQSGDRGLVYGQYIELDTIGTITFVGTTQNGVDLESVAIYSGQENVKDNYSITYSYGTLEITKRPISITAQDREKEYDGTPLYGSDPALVGKEGLAEGDSLSATYNGSQTIPGSSPVSINTYRITRGNLDVTYCYEIPDSDIIDGTLTVKPRELSITANSASKLYDNTPLSASGYSDIGKSGLLSGHRISSLDITGTITDAGTMDNVPSNAKIVDAYGEDVTKYYNIEYINGLLEIFKRKITISTSGAEKIYDGTPLTSAGYEIIYAEGDDGILAGEKATVLPTGSITDVLYNDRDEVIGTENTFELAVKKSDGVTDSTGNYEVTEILGTLTVSPRPLMFSTAGGIKAYDGTPLTNPNAYSQDAYAMLVSGHRFASIETTGSQLIVGTSENGIKVVIVETDDPSVDVTKNYDIQCECGTLQVIKHETPIQVATGSASKKYDGTPLTESSYELPNWESIQAQLKAAHTISVTTTGSLTEIGTEPNTYTINIMNGDVDVTECFDFEDILGVLEVTPPSLVLESSSDIKTYDGLPLESHSAYIAEGTLNEGDRIEYFFTGTATDVAYDENGNVTGVDNLFTAKIYDKDGNDVTDTYGEIFYKYGQLTVEPVDITIKAPNAVKQYDGTPLEAPLEIEDSISLQKLNQEFDYERFTWAILYSSASRTDIGITKYTFILDDPERGSAFQIYFDGVAVPMTNFNITCEEGTLRVVEKLLRIKLWEVVREYNGSAHSYGSSWWMLESNPDELTVELDLVGSLTDVGTLDNEELAERIVNENRITIYNKYGQDVTRNYAIVFDGKPLTVLPRSITITAASASKVYDGKELTAHSYTISIGSLADGHYIDDEAIEYTGSITGVGTDINSIDSETIIIRDQYGNDVTDNYLINPDPGTLTVIE